MAGGPGPRLSAARAGPATPRVVPPTIEVARVTATAWSATRRASGRVAHPTARTADGRPLLDDCTAVWLNSNGNGPPHDVNNVPHIIAGSADTLLPANLDDFRRLPNAALQVFSRAGHDVAIHEPDGVADAIDAFVRKGLARPAI